MKFALFALMLVALCACATALFDTTGNKMYVLAMEKCNANMPITLHGLWPEYAQDCSKQFDAKLLAPIRSELDKYWPACKEVSTKTSEEFWQHEYTKHGSCMKNLTQLEFFTLALEVRERFVNICNIGTGVGVQECRICLDANLNPC